MALNPTEGTIIAVCCISTALVAGPAVYTYFGHTTKGQPSLYEKWKNQRKQQPQEEQMEFAFMKDMKKYK